MTKHQLAVVRLGDSAAAWEASGFIVVRHPNAANNGATETGATETVQIGQTVIELSGTGNQFEGWSIDGVTGNVDGLVSFSPQIAPSPEAPAHPNGIVGIDHIVVITDDCQRTIAQLESVGLKVSGSRGTQSYGTPMIQTFLWAGDVIIELMGPEISAPASAPPAKIFGLALAADNFAYTAQQLGPLLGEPRDAVQAGRLIAGLRHKNLGMGLPVVVMSPHRSTR